ncbi:MAG: zf-HC2 domain-containing protein [bacterium]
MKPDKLNKQNHISCDLPIELLSAYIDNELNEIEKQKVEKHLKHCSHCVKVIDEFKTLDMGLREIEIEEPSKEFVFNLQKNVMEGIRKKRSSAFGKFVPILVPVAVVAILVIIISGYENITSPIGIKNMVDIVSVPTEKLEQADKIDVVIPKPYITSTIPKQLPAAPRMARERTPAAGKDVDLAYKETEATASAIEEMTSKKITPVIIRAVIDSTGKVLNVATGNTIEPQEDTFLLRMLKGRQVTPPTIRGKPAQMVVEFIAEEKDSSDVK